MVVVLERAVLILSIAFCLGFADISISATKDLILDTDVDMEDVLALFYLLKQDKTMINLKAITISANSWVNPGFGVNTVYDVLFMMGRDDIPVGIGGEGGIDNDGIIFPNVGGYLPLIDQRMSSSGDCRYRQAIPPGSKGGRLDVDTNYGLRRKFLPQGTRHYVSGKQKTAQQVMLEALSSGSNTVLLLGSHTSFALMLMTHPELKNNIEHVYIMGGGRTGNLFTGMESNPKAEFNIFADPLASYTVFYSGLPITLVPLDATNTVPVTDAFISMLRNSHRSLEADYAYQTLSMIKEIWPENFSRDFYMWDTFTSCIAISGMLNAHSPSKNSFATIYETNMTVVTSNKPYGVNDGSNPLVSSKRLSSFNLSLCGVHSGHVQTGLHDPFCYVPNGKGKCMDGSTLEVPEGASIQVAQSAKSTASDKYFYSNFIETMSSPRQTARFNFRTQFPYFRELEAKPNITPSDITRGKPLIFDMDVSPGDILTLIYLLKVPVDVIDLKAVTIAANGWANAGAVDIVYDVLHMMGRDDIPVGLGAYYAIDQSYLPFNKSGNCRYRKAVPNGAGGLLDSDTLYGLARELPRSPRRYTIGTTTSFGASRTLTAEHEFLNVFERIEKDSKVTILTGGPLTNIANFLLNNVSSRIEEIYVLGGSIHSHSNMGNLFTVPENTKAEFNIFLDPRAADKVLKSNLNIILVPLDTTRHVSLVNALKQLKHHKKHTPDSSFAQKLLSTFHHLKHTGGPYKFAINPLGEMVAAAILVSPYSLQASIKQAPVEVTLSDNIANEGWTTVVKHGHQVKYVKKIDSKALNTLIVNALTNPQQAAVVPSFEYQKELWSKPATPS